MTHTPSMASKLAPSLAIALSLFAPLAHAWSDAGTDYCPTAILRPGPGTLPADFTHLVADEWLWRDALSVVRVDPDGTTHVVELRMETRTIGTTSYDLVSIDGGWAEGERYRFSSTRSGCPAVEYLIGPPLGAPITLGTLDATEVSWTRAAHAYSQVTLTLAPEARAFIDLYDVELRVDGSTVALGALSETTAASISIVCGGSGQFEPGPHALSFHAGPPGAATTASTMVLNTTLSCPSEPPPPAPDSGSPDVGTDGGVTDGGTTAPPAAAACSVGAPGLTSSGYGSLLALALALVLRGRRKLS